MDRITPHGPLRAADKRHDLRQDEVVAGDVRGGSCEADRSALWLPVLRRYVVFIAAANLLWEIAQLPLYTIWSEGSVGEIAFAVVHCTGGDILIASFSLFGALLLVGNGRWPMKRYGVVACLASAAGLAYTIFSEWLNTEIRGSWVYTDFMPTLPLIGAGASPLAQWIVVPLTGFWWARRTVARTRPSLGATG